MSDVCERLRKAASAIYIAVEEPVADDISGMMKEAIAEIERLRSGWIRADTEPTESGDYLCWMMDARDEYNDIWREVVRFEVRKAFPNVWNVSNFDTVMYWMHIPKLNSGQNEQD